MMMMMVKNGDHNDLVDVDPHSDDNVTNKVKVKLDSNKTCRSTTFHFVMPKTKTMPAQESTPMKQ